MPNVREETLTATVPVSAIVPTRNRSDILFRTLTSLRTQGLAPAELIIVDASDDNQTQKAIEALERQEELCAGRIIWERAQEHGAAVQRNQGWARAGQPVIWFFDDDILFEPDCVARLWSALQSDAGLGGVSAMITNQCYRQPGRISEFMFRVMAGRREVSYAGRVLGPAINLLPEDREDLPEIVPVQWLNTTCVLYRREALPDPPFARHFSGYSMMEDLTLSLTVGKRWRLANARTARIFHDSQPGSHKSDPAVLAEMELVNRHYVMSQVLMRRSWADFLRLTIWEMFQIIVALTDRQGRSSLHRVLIGKIKALRLLAGASE
jgi:glycosyltransferase involved in cell wall biosynthesis